MNRVTSTSAEFVTPVIVSFDIFGVFLPVERAAQCLGVSVWTRRFSRVTARASVPVSSCQRGVMNTHRPDSGVARCGDPDGHGVRTESVEMAPVWKAAQML